MMMAACSELLCVTKFLPKKRESASGASGADQPFHVREVALQRLPPSPGEPELGSRHPAFEGFVAAQVSRFLQLAGMHAQIAVGGAEQMLELVEGEGLVDRERTHDRQPDPLVDQPV